MKKLIIFGVVFVVVFITYSTVVNKIENTSLKYINIILDDLQAELESTGACVVSDTVADISDIEVDLSDLTDEQIAMIEDQIGITIEEANSEQLDEIIDFTKAVCVLDADKASLSLFNGVHVGFSHPSIDSRYTLDLSISDAISLASDYKNIDHNKILEMLNKVG